MRLMLEERRETQRCGSRSVVSAALGGVLLGYLGARLLGPARRRGAVLVRHGRRRLRREGRVRAAFVRGQALRLAHRVRPAAAVELDDVTLAHKVESVLFRDPAVPKGRISINAEDGSVFLRGEVGSDDLIRELERAVRRIPGVRDVENLLHLPGTLAPHSAPPA